MGSWFREIAVSLGFAAGVLAIGGMAIAFGVLISLKIDHGNEWIAAAAAAGLILFLILVARLWWTWKRSL
jgi:hypothetical protein